jgi:SAM-dependent methyltransferase
MFYLKYLLKNAWLTVQLLAQGEWRRVAAALHARAYVVVHRLMFPLRAPFARRRNAPLPDMQLAVLTDHPVAFASPDYQVPHGTKYNNSTNRKFVLLMNDYFCRQFPQGPCCFMDLGCSGGQLVADFASLRWIAVGLEGSDYSLKRQRANWRTLANRNLFTCDISKAFRVQRDGQDLGFHLITSWDVLEHIQRGDLETLFRNVATHLVEGGLFVASTSSRTSVVDGVELHQTRMANAEWRAWIESHFPELERVDLGLKVYQYVRFDFGEPSFLVYRKRRVLAEN